ncbi:hypothetical protein [Streptomyces sp. CoH17]|uniref:hypothetical protein n=1 Tax=Streptomyces sp. CoH17 TaxID=2992806 RepID=UPI00226F3201|nr:hypothetical protein [Streptomyces sp. CoH17]
MAFKVKTLVPNVYLPNGYMYPNVDTVIVLTDEDYRALSPDVFTKNILQDLGPAANSGDNVYTQGATVANPAALTSSQNATTNASAPAALTSSNAGSTFADLTAATAAHNQVVADLTALRTSLASAVTLVNALKTSYNPAQNDIAALRTTLNTLVTNLKGTGKALS